MAFLPPEQENQYAPQGQTSSNPAGSGGTPPPQVGGSAGAGTSGQAKPAATSAGGTPTQFGSSASKLGDYLNANAPQIQNQANNITTGLNNQYGQIQNDITGAINQFGQQVQGGYTAGNKSVVDQAASDPLAFAYTSTPGTPTPNTLATVAPQAPGAVQNKLNGIQQVPNAPAAPNNTYTPNTQNISNFQKQYNDQYTGPQNFESTTPYSNVQNEVNSAVQKAGLLSNPAGLQSYFAAQAGPNATKASNTLDSLLLNGNPQAQQQIQTAAKQFGGLSDQFGQATAGANQGVQSAQQAAQAAQDYAHTQFNPITTKFQNTLNDTLNQAQGTYTNNANNNEALQQAINNNGTLTPQEAATLNIKPEDYQKLLGNINQYTTMFGSSPVGSLGQYLTPGTASQSGPPSLANVATNQQYQTAGALGQLLGSGYNNPLDPTNISQAGTFNQGYTPATFNLATAQNDVKNNFLNTDARYAASFNPQSGGAFTGITGFNPQAQADAAWQLKYLNPSTPWVTPTYQTALQQLANGEI